MKRSELNLRPWPFEMKAFGLELDRLRSRHRAEHFLPAKHVRDGDGDEPTALKYGRFLEISDYESCVSLGKKLTSQALDTRMVTFDLEGKTRDDKNNERLPTLV